MTEKSHPDVDDEQFDERDRTEVEEWHIFLRAYEPAHITSVHHAITEEEYADKLNELDLMPESIQLNTLSFYFKGTYKEAYIAAQEKCDKLNNEADIDNSRWTFESETIMIA